jgi:hypothetical protein
LVSRLDEKAGNREARVVRDVIRYSVFFGGGTGPSTGGSDLI